MTTDTKRLRELHSQYWWAKGGGLSPDEAKELRSLILAACEELESAHQWRPISEAQNALIVGSVYAVSESRVGYSFNTLAKWTSQGTFWCSEIDDVLGAPSHVLCAGLVPVAIPTKDPDHD